MDSLILIMAAFVTSIISGTIGMGGGILLLAVMANFLTPLLLIPLHGIVQLSSNVSRTALNWRHIDGPIARSFAIGAIVGASFGLFTMLAMFGSFFEASELTIGTTKKFNIPDQEYKIFLGSAILLLTWLPKFKNSPHIPGKFYWVGAVATFLSLFVGATGPLIAPFFLREGLVKEALVVTKAASQAIVHSTKLIVYFYLGFQIGDHLQLIVLMSAAVFFGNWVGKKLLGKISQNSFVWAFRLIITLLALRMILIALF